MTFRASIADFQLANPLYTAATVTFYAADENGERGDLATLYRNPTGPATVNNPQTLDSEGKLSAPVYHAVPLIAEVTGPNVGTHSTGVLGARGVWRGTWLADTVYYTGDTLGDPSDPHTVYMATQDFLSSDSFDDDVTDGKIELRLTGGDVMFMTIDDPGLPASGETWRTLITEDCRILAGFSRSHAIALVAAAAPTVWSIKKDGVQIGTITWGTGQTVGVFASGADVDFEPLVAAPIVLSVVAQSPRDAALEGVAITIRLNRLQLG